MRGQLQVQRDRDVRVRVVEGFVASEDQSALLALQNLRDSLYGSVKACALVSPPSDNPVRMLARGHFTKVATKFCRRDNVQRRTTRHNVRVEEKSARGDRPASYSEASQHRRSRRLLFSPAT